MSRFATIEEAIEEIRAGRMVVVCDDEDRENEGDLTLAAQFATPEAINFMAKEGRGLICLALTPDRCDELGLDLMAAKNESPFETAFTVSVEARDGVTTGISAADRARTIQVAIDPSSAPRDLVQPGHIFPLKAKPGGVLEQLTADVMVFEQGRLDRSRTDYAREHLGEDIGFAATTRHSVLRRSARIQGAVAWIMSVNRTRGKVRDRDIDLVTDETMVLVRVGNRWRIAHIHWSFDDRGIH